VRDTDCSEMEFQMKIRFCYVATAVGFFVCGAAAMAILGPSHAIDLGGIFSQKYAIIWSGVFGATIAAVLALLGVVAANSSSLDRLNKQHIHDKAEAIEQRNHDAEQKNEDRKAEIRREVYTKAVEEVHAVLAVIGGLPDRPLSDSSKDADALQLFLKANAKVWLVAESEAAQLSRELTSLMSELYLSTLASSRPLRFAMEPVRKLDRQALHAESEVLRIEQRITELKEKKASNHDLEPVVTSWHTTNDWLNTLTIERQRQLDLIRPARLTHAKAMFEEMRPVQLNIVRLVSSLRKELGLSSGEIEFLQQLQDMEARSLAALNSL
jgi:hypothetical protein